MAYSKQLLRRLRNEIPIAALISEHLKLETKADGGYIRFLCPVCKEFRTATNPKTNLARCFRCEKNFNPVDMVMIVKRYNFKEAVQYLKGLDPQRQTERRDALAEMLPNLLKRTP